ncbi:MAG: hypothetical protein AAF125_25025, partial [Chloroflexota bacterium]
MADNIGDNPPPEFQRYPPQIQEGDVKVEPLNVHQRTSNQSPPQHKRGGLGCLFPFFIALFLAVVLVGVALLLPPFSLLDRLTGVQYVMLDAQNNAARSPDEALTLVLNPADPGQDYGVALGTVPQEAFASGQVATNWAVPARDALPGNLSLVSPIYTVETTGNAP